MNKYAIIYDYITDPNSFSLSEKLLIPMGGGLLLFYIYKKGIRKYKKFTIVTACIAIVIASIAGIFQYKTYTSIVEKIEKGETKTVTGKVNRFKPLDMSNHGSYESFEVDGEKFFFSDYHRVDGYHHACINGGVICDEGQEIKLEYYIQENRNFIVKIYVTKDWKPKHEISEED
jgi:hypothetical protein